jgi:hypothetical protein
VQVVGRLHRRIALGDVVDSPLDDQGVGALGAGPQPPGDLVGSLAEGPAVSKPESRRRSPGPVLVLTALVVAEPESAAGRRIGVVAGRARRDRVAKRGDDDLALVGYGRLLGLARPARAERERARGDRQQSEPAYVYIPPN